MARINSTFCILGGDVQNIALLAAHYGRDLVSVEHRAEADATFFRVRYIRDGGMFDDAVSTFGGRVTVEATVTILAARAA